MKALVRTLKGGLIVSCQAASDSPVHGPRWMAGFARAAELGGAVGMRVNGPADVRSVRRVTRLPIIGIYKRQSARYPVYITPTFEAARAVVEAGANIVALDATHRARPGAVAPGALIRRVRGELHVPVMADVDSLEEGVAAAEDGADLVATTMAGYTSAGPASAGPDLDLLAALAARVHVPVVCEGRIGSPDDVRAAFAAGAFAVVVGTAITNPVAMTARFADATPRSRRMARQKAI